MSSISSKKGTTIHDLPIEERPRERALLEGVRRLKDEELIAITIGSGTRGASALDLARELLAMRQGDLFSIYQELLNNIDPGVKGLGSVKRMQIVAAQELGVRTLQRRNQRKVDNQPQLLNSAKIYDYITSELIGKVEEEMWVVLVDAGARPRFRQQVSQGGLSGTTADVRIILRTALQYSSMGLAVVHNHPGGSLAPSQQDDEFTRKLYMACRAVDITFMDHIIYTEAGYYSYHDENRFYEYR